MGSSEKSLITTALEDAETSLANAASIVKNNVKKAASYIANTVSDATNSGVEKLNALRQQKYEQPGESAKAVQQYARELKQDDYPPEGDRYIESTEFYSATNP